MQNDLEISKISNDEVLALLRYRLPDAQADVELEIKDYLKGVSSEHSLVHSLKSAFSASDPIQFYRSNSQFYLDLFGIHLKLSNILERTALLMGTALKNGIKTYADWGAGSGRDCIGMARIGVRVTHLDVLGKNIEIAKWRYTQRNLNIQIADVLNPPNERYDLISNFDCLEHLENPVEALGQMIERLNSSGILFLVGDFYNFSVDAPDVHLPKNFVYGGITQMALKKIGFKQLFGLHSVWAETALAYCTVWQKPVEIESKPLVSEFYQEIYRLISCFESYYNSERERIRPLMQES